jgi:protein involved in polysaccharide export with SLBB domain
MDVNFEKLFLQGDLTQNVALAPDDYLYFPPMDVPEVYVLGEVLRPGVTSFTPGMSAMKAVSSAGGFTPKAWRQKVLIVRGSLTAPKTFVLDAGDVLAARTTDFKLEARDIIYVYRKPWARAEELLEIAITDFLDAAIITYTGQHVGPFITSPIIK